MPKKILIIKLGYSETLDSEIGKIPSLGDVLRTTPILWALKERFPDSHITWLVSEHAEQLLKGNSLIDRLLVWDEFIPFQLMREKIDVLINLEKIPGVAALADMIDAWIKYGFRFDSNSGNYHSYERGLDMITYIEEKKRTKKLPDYWQKILVEMIGVSWSGQEYVMGYQPVKKDMFDIGLNYKVGRKWPTKAMSDEKWHILAEDLKNMGFVVSWQQGFDDLIEYMEWVNSCRMLISQDSLGLHLALAFKKKLIALWGPTNPQEIYPYQNTKIVRSDSNCDLMPCYGSECENKEFCMDKINIKDIVDAVMELEKGRFPEFQLQELKY